MDSEREAMAREMLLDRVFDKGQCELPEPRAAVSMETAVALALAFSDRERATRTPEAPEQPATERASGEVERIIVEAEKRRNLTLTCLECNADDVRLWDETIRFLKEFT